MLAGAAGLRIEEGTAKFYLDVAEGNLKDAIALYGECYCLLFVACMLFEVLMLDDGLHHAVLCCNDTAEYAMLCKGIISMWCCRARHGMGASK